jgi:hypothetical protein
MSAVGPGCAEKLSLPHTLSDRFCVDKSTTPFSFRTVFNHSPHALMRSRLHPAIGCRRRFYLEGRGWRRLAESDQVPRCGRRRYR